MPGARAVRARGDIGWGGVGGGRHLLGVSTNVDRRHQRHARGVEAGSPGIGGSRHADH